MDELETLSGPERADLQETAARVLGRVGIHGELASTVVVDLGWTAIGLPQAHGGAGYGQRERAVIAEVAGRSLTGEALWPTLGLSLPLLSACKADDLGSDLVAGRRMAVGWAGPHASTFSEGFHSPSLRLASGHVAGRLEAVSGAVGVDLLLAPAEDASGDPVVVAFDAAISHPVEAAAGHLDPNGLTGAVDVEGSARVIATGAAARRAWQEAGECAQVWLAAESLGIASHLLDLAVEHAREREQFGRPIGSYQAVSHELADLYADVELARSSVAWAAEAVDLRQDDSRAAVLVASLMADRAAVAASEKTIQVLGGLGMTWESQVHRYFKRALTIERFDGTRRDRLRRLGDLVLPAPMGQP